jgi:predicted translation initiation factor SUI1
MKTEKRMNDFADLRSILPESIQIEIQKMEHAEKKNGHDGKGKSIRVTLDKKGRKGKTVTLVTGFQHNPQTMQEIAKILKGHCGAGGTIKGMVIEIQGDQRQKIAEKLRELNYFVK